MSTCPGCARELPAQPFPFCPWCGRSLDGEPLSGQRKTLTVLFADLVDSTVLGSTVDPEVLRGLLVQYWDGARRVVEAHGGTVEKYIGDAVVGVFGIPVVHEDDGLRAARAALDLVETVAQLSRRSEERLGVRLEVRVGVSTGEVFTGDGAQTLMSGDTANVAARLQTTAEPGQVLIGESTFVLVRDAAVVEPLGALTLKGKAEPVTAYRLQALRADAGGRRRRRFSGPMLGRDRQLALVQAMFAAVHESSASALLTVVGEPGMGKSRLVDEFLAFVGEPATVLMGGCLPYGEGITYAPLTEMVSRLGERGEPGATLLAGVDHADRIVAGLNTLTGASSATVTEMLWAFRRLLELMAAQRPVVVVVDDLQWAEPALVELVRELVGQLRHLPVLVVVMARPGLLAAHPTWPSLAVTSALVLLSPLSGAQSRQLTSSLLGPGVPDDLERRVSEAAEGIPLFVEETVAMLVDEGALVEDGSGSWAVHGSIDDVPVPATVRALLAARIDQLAPMERDVVDAAAVVGRTFYREAVVGLVSPGTDVDGCIAALVRSDLVQPVASDLPGLDAYSFSHSLTGETAYSTLPKSRRVMLHLRAARWMQEQVDDQSFDGVVAFHLEQAVTHQEGLGIDDPATRTELGTLLVHLSQRSAALGDAHSAVRYAERAVRWEPESAVARIALSKAAWHTGDAETALAASQQAERVADGTGDLVGQWRAAVWRQMLHSFTEQDADPRTMLEMADRAEVALQGDHAGLADVCRLRADACNWLGRVRESGQEAMTALEHELHLPASARRIGDLVVAAMMPVLFGDVTLAEGEERLSRLEALVGDDPGSQRGLTDARQWMMAARGDVARALVEMREHADLLLEQGSPLWAAEVLASGMQWSYLWTGELDRAVEVLTRAIELKRDVGEIGMRATWLAELSVLLAQLRRFDDARAALEESRSITPVDDIASVLEQSATRGLLMAAEGNREGAVEVFSRAARELPRGNEMVFSQAHLYLAWAQTCGWLGDRPGRERLLHQTLRLVERKGFPPPVEYVRSLMETEPSRRLAP